MSAPATCRPGFTRAQVDQLLQPIHTNRVLRDGKGHSHVSQQDVLAHLTRIFGFGNWDIDVRNIELVFETERLKNGEPTGRWDVCYRAMARLTVRDPEGREICHYEDGSTATAQNQTRGDGHDLAYKSAISLSKKRAAIHLGDQFGLSLYNKGQTKALVIGTLVLPEGDVAAADVQADVPEQVSLGNDEIERPMDGGEPAGQAVSSASSAPAPPAAAPPPVPAARQISQAAQRLLIEAEEAATVAALGLVWTAITALLRQSEITQAEADQVRARVQELKAQLTEVAA
ncbi:Rad52/Rad22 family DNA repair protein [Streptosporangium sp. NPDC006007]|uniref:Rad52/Rad22 family DNA repair protein n=1 Tax=Streptosporangium sp. NPDC006007 TaxID=3154575 RepID=UPI0033AD5854